MKVSLEQRALLDLILRRGLTYAEIADLIGTDPGEARARAHQVLADLVGSDPDERAELSDFLLGQLEPAAADRVRRDLERDPPSLDLALELSAKLRLIAPRGELPDLPAPGDSLPPPTASPAAPPPSAAAAPRPAPATEPQRSALSRRVRGDPRFRNFSLALLVAVGALVIGLVAALGGDGTDEQTIPSTAAEAPASDAGQPASNIPTVVVKLKPRDAGPPDAAGTATIAPTSAGTAIEYRADGLEPTHGSQRYVVWLYNGREAAVPVTAGRRVGEGGDLSGLAAIPPRLVRALPETRFVDVSLEPQPQRPGATAYRGASVLRGILARRAPDGP